MVLFPLIFFSVTGTYLLPFLWGLMDGLRCCASNKGGGGSVYWLTAKSESPWTLQAPHLRLAMHLLTKLFSKLDIKFIK